MLNSHWGSGAVFTPWCSIYTLLSTEAVEEYMLF